MIVSRGKLVCSVTRYAVLDGELQETTREEETNYEVEGGWLYLGNSAASAQVYRLVECAKAGEHWGAQAGTAPVLADGSWGGRNYPAIVVGADELRRVLVEEAS